MALYCADGGRWDDFDWYWEWDQSDPRPLTLRRGRRCCSCRAAIRPGDLASIVRRFRRPNCEVERRIHGEDGEVYLASWYLCETCWGLALALDELGFCFSLGEGESLREQIAEYRRAESGA